MAAPNHISPTAVELLEKNGWAWSEYHFSFRRARRKDEALEEYLKRPPDLITYEELMDHGLSTSVDRDEVSVSNGLQWLRSKLVEEEVRDSRT